MSPDTAENGAYQRVLSTPDLTVICFAVVCFVVQASVLRPAGAAAFTFWMLGAVLFLLPTALASVQLGRMFPVQGSLYAWTQEALGPFWGFFAGFCAWWPGILVMVATADLVVTGIQWIDPAALRQPWQQGLAILAVLWLSAAGSLARLRVGVIIANAVVAAYALAIVVIGAAGVAYLVRGGHPAESLSAGHSWLPSSANWSWFGLIVLALLGVEIPLNMAGELRHARSIKRALYLGSAAIIVAYLWASFGVFVTLPRTASSPSAVFDAVARGFGSHPLAVAVAVMTTAFFAVLVAVYNTTFSRLVVVAAIEGRLPRRLGGLSRRGQPTLAILAQTLIATAFTMVSFGPWAHGRSFANQAYLIMQAGVTVIWCIATLLLCLDVVLVRRARPDLFAQTRIAPTPVLIASAVIGSAASFIGAAATLRAPWDTTLFGAGAWRLGVVVVVVASFLVALILYVLSAEMRGRADGAELEQRRQKLLARREAARKRAA